MNRRRRFLAKRKRRVARLDAQHWQIYVQRGGRAAIPFARRFNAVERFAFRIAKERLR